MYKSPNVNADALYCYFDPIDRLSDRGRERWADPANHEAILSEALEAARSGAHR